MIQRQAAEYRARFAGRQLGANLLESVRKKPAKTVLLLRVFLHFFSTVLLRKLFIRLFSRREKAPEKIHCHEVLVLGAGG